MNRPIHSVSFTKAHGAGNDFLVVDRNALAGFPSLEERIQAICERHTGVGADGVLLLATSGSAGADADLRIFNSDGGEAEISGNGTRCAAAFLVDSGHSGQGLSIRTGAGVKRLTLLARDGNRFSFEMEMGKPELRPAAIPFRPPEALPGPVVGFALPLNAGSRTVTVTSMGNPHCSLLVEDFDWDWKALGSEIERHPFFPNRTNVEFCRVCSRNEVEARFWERGVGHTLSSGTGSCAAALAAILNRRAVSPVTVRTLAGDLTVRSEPEGIYLTGPAEIICRGEYFAP